MLSGLPVVNGHWLPCHFHSQSEGADGYKFGIVAQPTDWLDLFADDVASDDVLSDQCGPEQRRSWS